MRRVKEVLVKGRVFRGRPKKIWDEVLYKEQWILYLNRGCSGESQEGNNSSLEEVAQS